MMRKAWKRITSLALGGLLFLSTGAAVLAAEPAAMKYQEGTYTLTTDKGAASGRETAYEEAELTVNKDGSMSLELWMKSTLTQIKKDGQPLTAGEPVSKGGTIYYPVTFPLADKQAAQNVKLSIQMGSSVRPVDYVLNFDNSTLFSKEASTGIKAVPVAASTASGAASTNLYGFADVTAGDTYTAVLYGTNLLKKITYGGTEYLPEGTGVEKEGTVYYPITVPLADHSASQVMNFTIQMGSAERSVEYNVQFTDETLFPTAQTCAGSVQVPVTAASASSGKVSEHVYGTADVVTADTYQVTLYVTDAIKGISQGENSYVPDAAKDTEIGATEYIPYKISLTEKTDSLALTAYVSAMGRDVNASVNLSGWETIPTVSGQVSGDVVEVQAMANGRDGQPAKAEYIHTKGEIVEKDSAYVLTIYSKYRISYENKEIEKDTSKAEVDGFAPYTFTMKDKKAEQDINAIISMGSRGDVPVAVKLTLTNDKYFKTEEKPGENEKPNPNPGTNPGGTVSNVGTYKIAVANASTSSYGKTTVYPDATLEIKADGTCTITIYLKDSLENIRTTDGVPVSAGAAAVLTMQGESGTYYPYTFPISMRQAVLTIKDDVPAMAHVPSMNYGKDMSTTINVDWSSAAGLEIKGLTNGYYELPVAFQTPSSMITLESKANVEVKDSMYTMRLYFPTGTVNAVSYEGEEAKYCKGDVADTYVITMKEEAGQIPVKIAVAQMAGTKMEVQSFVIIPDWTQAKESVYTEIALTDAPGVIGSASSGIKPSAKKTPKGKKNPKTGDSTMPIIVYVEMMIGAALIGGELLRRRKRQGIVE